MTTSERFRRTSRTDGGAFRWQQVAALEEEGFSLPEIAERLDLAMETVRTYHLVAAAHRAREEEWAVPLERFVRRMAAVYPDDERRRWIYRQMRLEYEG